MPKLFVSIILLVAIASCQASNSSKIITSSNPAAAIVRQVATLKTDVEVILKPGSNPHFFQPKPSHARIAETGIALVYLGDKLDGWAAKLPAKQKISLFGLVPDSLKLYFSQSNPEDSLAAVDPHFWTDPIIVSIVAGRLADTLGILDPDNADIYQSNAKSFQERIALLDKEIRKIIKPVEGKQVFLQHPSFRYFIERYNLNYGGALEAIPGVEPGPAYISRFMKKVENSDSPVLFAESIGNHELTEMIGENAPVIISELDPVGGQDGRKKYSDLMIYNARNIATALAGK